MNIRELPALAWDALLLELALYGCLGRWITRRRDVPAHAIAIGYAHLVGPMLWLWIFGSATEVVVVEVVLRSIDSGWSEAIRLPLLAAGIWGVLWMLGLMAAYRTRPHLLTPGWLRIRNSARTWVEVPLDAVASTRTTEHELPGIVKAVHLEDGLLLIGVSSRTNLELALTGPTVLRTSKGDMTADKIGLWVDEPRRAAEHLKAMGAAWVAS